MNVLGGGIPALREAAESLLAHVLNQYNNFPLAGGLFLTHLDVHLQLTAF